ncbi:MAG TPA: hypothetical protein VKY73_08710 [Polyangiaceae bacterium]|nr:hypothetical protein [Polyangiaceae bacterium]
MKSWLATVAPIATAAVLGALLAFTIGRRSPTASSEPVVHSAIDAEAAEVDATVSWSATKEAVAASPTAGPEVVPMGPAEDGARPEASRPSLPLRVGPTLIAPTTRDALLQEELACARDRLPEACERTALALETGSAQSRDPVRAPKVWRVALALYLEQCEKNRVPACARLADMQEHGERIQKNRQNAEALRRRIETLCKANPAREGCASLADALISSTNTP